MNRFQSIVDNVSIDTFVEVGQMFPHLASGNIHWFVSEDGQLMAHHGGDDYEFSFQKGDAASEALVLLLNRMPYILQAAGAPR